MTRRLDPEETKGVMLAAKLDPLEPYRGAKAPWRCRCMTCGREVCPSYDRVRIRGTGCAWCVGGRLEPETRRISSPADIEEWMDVCRERENARGRAWRRANPEKHREFKRRWRSGNLEAARASAREQARRRYERNPEEERQRSLKWARAHPDKTAARRAMRLEAFIAPVIKLDIFERDRWICQICHKKVNKRLKWPNRLAASLDHIIPLARGGTHEPRNVQLAHLTCNLSKNAGARNDQTRLL